MTNRALEVLRSVDYIGAEDTRNSGKLMAFFNIDKPFISCHEHNEEEASNKIISLLKQGKKVAFMSDAGYPAISDPGSRLVSRCLEAGIKVSVTSGPCAAINALACSGLDSTHFYFEGFLPAKESEKVSEIESLKDRKETLILYESPHRINKTLVSLFKGLGDRKICICRELTKAHEEFIRVNLSEAVTIDEETLKGEMVLVVEGNNSPAIEISDELIIDELTKLINKGQRKKDAVNEVSQHLNVNKNRVYSLSLKI